MPRKIIAAQKRAPDFYKSDALVQINQIKYSCFFLHGTENTKFFFSRSKHRNKNPGLVFLDFIFFFNIAVKKFSRKNNFVELELSKEIFSSPEYPNFGSKFSKFGKFICNYFYVVR